MNVAGHSISFGPATTRQRLDGRGDSGDLARILTDLANSDPTAAEPLADNSTDTSIDIDRFDQRQDGSVDPQPPSGTSLGPRQRRFDFDSRVIRDSIVRKLQSVGRDDVAFPLDNCHRHPSYKRCTGCRTVKTYFNRCERFYCPICAARLARDRRESVEWWSKVVRQPKHIVLTVKSVPILDKAYVRKLKSDFRKLRTQKWAKDGEFLWRATAIRPGEPTAEPMKGRKRRRGRLSPWRGTPLGNKTTAWRGGFWSIDCTWHRDIQSGETYRSNGDTHVATEPVLRGWHVHLHIIADADFIDREKLETEWSRLRGQQMSIVRVYDVRNKDYTAEACRYVCDGVQLGNWPAEKLAEFADALADERCFDTFGALYKQRAEWTAAKKLIHEDRDICPCGCHRFEFFSADEWEWQQIKSSLPPPVLSVKPPARPELQPNLIDCSFRPSVELAYGVR